MKLRHSRKVYMKENTTQKKLREIVTLKDGISWSLRKLLSIIEDLDINNVQQIWAVKGQYTAKNLRENICQIKRWGVVKLYLWSNKLPCIVSSFENIQFYQLKEMHIGWNQIDSIENLSRVYFNSLTDLVLRQNRINSLKGLKKSNFPKIKDICMRGNFITSVSALIQGNFNFLINLNFNNNIIFENRDFIKISSRMLQFLRTKTLNNIREPSFILQKVSARKWEQLAFMETIKN